MFRIILNFHRYLGIAFGLIVLLWCLSAFVMMYVQYPSLSDADRLRGLPQLEITECCRIDALRAGQLSIAKSFSVEMFDDDPALFVESPDGERSIVDLGTGRETGGISDELAIRQARMFLQESGADSGALNAVRIERDQWTVANRFNTHRPLIRVQSAEGTEIYVSSRDGRIVQVTNARERFWNWLGSVIHWTYPTMLRKNPAAWSAVVIGLSGIATVMAFLGLYLGCVKTRQAVGVSPYRGINLWHHLSGLLFGALTVTWLLSGLLSMNPLGLLSGSDSADPWRGQRVISGAEIQSFVAALGSAELPRDTVSLRSMFTGGELAVAASDKHGETFRLDAQSLVASPITNNDWINLGRDAAGNVPIASAGMLESADNYYFSHHESVAFPVYRIVLDDADSIRHYLDADTGELVKTFDRDARLYRWAFGAFHRGDFHTTLRTRPLWDIVILILLAGVTVGAATGVILAVRWFSRK